MTIQFTSLARSRALSRVTGRPTAADFRAFRASTDTAGYLGCGDTWATAIMARVTHRAFAAMEVR